MKNSNKISILLIFIIALFINGCSERFLSDFLNGVQQPGSNDNQATGGGGNSGSTGGSGDSGSTGGSGDSGSTGGNGDSDSTGGSGDSGSTGGDDSGDTGGGDSGGTTTVNACDPSTVVKPIKRLIAGTLTAGNKIYYSDDLGKTWTASTFPNGLPTTHFWQAFEDLGNGIVLAGSAGNITGGFDLGGGLGIMKSTDSGKTWKRTTINNEDSKGLKVRDFLHIGGGVVIAAGDMVGGGGIWRSTDYGETWNQNIHKNSADWGRTPETADGISIGLTSGLALLPDGRILVTRSQQVDGGKQNPIYFSEDNGITWYSPVVSGSTDIAARGSGETIVLKNGYVVMAGQANGSMPFSSGKYDFWNWPVIALRFNGTGDERNVGFEYITELRDGTIIGGGYSVNNPNKGEFQVPGIWRSRYFAENQGQAVNDNDYINSYTQVFDSFGWRGIIGLDNCDVIVACMSVGITGTEDKSQCDGLYKSTDRGTTWNKMQGLSGFEISSIIAIR